MALNHGRLAHWHGLNALEALEHEYWNRDLVRKVREELEEAARLLDIHLERVSCPCGDTQEDVAFYRELCEWVVEAERENTLFPLPLVQEALEAHFRGKTESHRCLWRLMEGVHHWVERKETG
ncbi:hypothetical protein [Desmospora profundinema]|uniref:Uncharacterized protein n=1 Tax=Desmospora profundinema TaxID=1571184 RepID=A0ABU1IPA6_9BACL|nr:hypothetical protein [Desmospora profundinema]MDR6226551.1 hypothetical protein [Desmospora profundinema]